jgi:CHAD domain-containing protein
MSAAKRWISRTIRRERRALERARRRFVRKPTEECLHDVRTRGRRLRSLLEDVASIKPLPKLRKRVKRAAEITDKARNATVLRALLDNCCHPDERANTESLLAQLHAEERTATRWARKRLRRLRIGR